jgi:hypothetical protein
MLQLMAVRILLGENGKKKTCGKYIWDIITKRFRENLNLAMCKDSRSSSDESERLLGSREALEKIW